MAPNESDLRTRTFLVDLNPEKLEESVLLKRANLNHCLCAKRGRKQGLETELTNQLFLQLVDLLATAGKNQGTVPQSEQIASIFKASQVCYIILTSESLDRSAFF